MSTRLKRWARAIQQIDLSKRTDPETAIGYLTHGKEGEMTRITKYLSKNDSI